MAPDEIVVNHGSVESLLSSFQAFEVAHDFRPHARRLDSIRRSAESAGWGPHIYHLGGL